jgi:superfamily II DNA or RNA helicase
MNTPRKSKFRPFAEARTFIQSLNLSGNKDWRDWAKSSDRPNDIPAAPDRTYKDAWVSWGDFLGTGTLAPKYLQINFRPFKEARDFVHSKNFKGQGEWREWIASGHKPTDIPTAPESTYKNDWVNWGDWLGTGTVAFRFKEYLSFEDAKKFIHEKKIKSNTQWRNWSKTSERPSNIPVAPEQFYINEWIDWGDWLGTNTVATNERIYKSFLEARQFARAKKFKGQTEWFAWTKTPDKPIDIPANPSSTYQEEWISWGDWLGSYSHWKKTALIGFVKSLYPILPHLDPSELYSILRNNNCLNAIEQLGEDSPLKRLVSDTLHGDLEGIAETFAEIDKLDASASDEEILADIAISEHEITKEIIPIELDTEELPKLSPTQTLDNLDHLENVLGISDEETIEFLINKAIGRLWAQVLRSTTADDEIKRIRAHVGATYSTQVKERFLEQYSGATSLGIPAGYSFKKNKELIKPNLMQRLVAYRLLTEHRLGNWSGTGAGKTLGAILGSRIIDAKLTVIIGLNNTILDEKSGWAGEIKNAFPNSNILIKEKRGLIYSETQPNYLLLNYETFQLSDSRAVVDEILDKHKVDLIVLDEVHSAKSRNQIESKRRTLINYLLLKASEANPDLRVLGMSATPVVNSLDEAVSLIEMIKGREYNELDTSPKLSNALAIHEQLVINGIRYVPNYAIELKETPIEIIDNSITSELQSIGKGQVLQIEIALLKAKLKTIIELCKPGTIIYSIFVDEIFDLIANAVKTSGLRVARFNGDDKSGIDLFKQGKAEVLIGSSALGTGVDGLQYVCNRLIITSLPWTSAGYEQLLGRIYRQGSKFTEVEVFIPQVTLTNNGDTWSWDKQRLARIKYKKTLADAAIDGTVPEANLVSPSLMLAEAKKALNDWVVRLESGEVYELSRKELKVPLPPEIITKAIHKYGDFSAMNQRFNTSKSSTMHDRLASDPEEFYLYHSLYRKARETWSEVPYQVIATQLNKRPDWVIGDFGCGEALLSKSLRNKVYSFDHVAINPSVIACDMAHTGLGSEILDVVVFSLSLMGVNWEDYLKEAFRLLRNGSLLKVAEPAASWAENNYASLKQGIESAGFELLGESRLSSKFIYIDAIKPL